MTVCENCFHEVQDGRKHISDGEGRCVIAMIDTEQVVGWTNRKTRDLYKKK